MPWILKVPEFLLPGTLRYRRKGPGIKGVYKFRERIKLGVSALTVSPSLSPMGPTHTAPASVTNISKRHLQVPPAFDWHNVSLFPDKVWVSWRRQFLSFPS